MFHILKEDITSYCQPCPLYLINVIPLFLTILTRELYSIIQDIFYESFYLLRMEFYINIFTKLIQINDICCRVFCSDSQPCNVMALPSHFPHCKLSFYLSVIEIKNSLHCLVFCVGNLRQYVGYIFSLL